MQNSEYCLIVTTFSDDTVGKTIINSLINKRLVACIQIMPIESYYHWEGEVNCDNEKLVLIKTKDTLYTTVEKDILQNHDYDTPEVIKIPINAGYSGYLNWINNECISDV